MLFNSIPFVLSFFLFWILYRKLNTKHQNILLFLYGLYFYSLWNWKMSLLILFSIAVNFSIGLLISPKKGNLRKKWMLVGVVFNLCLLGIFKYTLFLFGIIEDIGLNIDSEFSIWKPEILLPVGVSFYTFHNISYLVELYKERIPVCNSFLDLAIYDLFFPLLLAGPIERPGSLLPQIQSKRIVTNESMIRGISIFCYGIFLKASIADPLAKYVDHYLNSFLSLPQGILWFVAPTFAFQVYADFFGYSLCAMGLADIIGFRLMNNFNRPFFSMNPAEFWTRWHISLSSWLRDYVYIPLGGNRLGFLRQNLNIMVVWILGGLWHGATYGYLVWGIYLGFCIVLYRIFIRYVDLETLIAKWGKKFQILVSTFGLLITFFSFSFGLLLFRVSNTSDIWILIKNLTQIGGFKLYYFYVILFFIPVLAFDFWQEKRNSERPNFFIEENPFRFFIIFSILFVLFSFVSPFEKQDFFYFQF